MFCGGAVALYSLVGSDPLAHNHRTKLLGHDSTPPPAASSDLTEYIAKSVWFRAKCCFHVFCTFTREEWDQAKPAGPVGICAIGVQGGAYK